MSIVAENLRRHREREGTHKSSTLSVSRPTYERLAARAAELDVPIGRLIEQMLEAATTTKEPHADEAP